MVCIHTIRALTTLGWNNMSACLSRPRTWLPLKGRELGSCPRLYLYLQHMAAHSLYMHRQDHIKSQEEILKVSGKSFMTSRLPGGATDEKESSLSLSILNSCHINNFLHWDIQIPHKQFTTGPCEASRRKRQYAFILIYLPQNLLVKWVFHGNTRETLFHTHSIQTESHSALGSTLRIQQGLWSCIKLTKASQLTFPAPTGPTTANSSPGLTVKERSCRVGVSDAYKLKFIKMYPF